MNGEGTVYPDLSQQELIVGKTYSLTAKPGANRLFTGWSGSFKAATPKITFVMRSNLVLQANFIPNPFVPGGGNYYGLLYEDDAVRLQSAGFFQMRVTTRGTYSGRLYLAGSRYSFRGQFNLQCQSTNLILRRGTNALVLELSIGGQQGDELTGRLTDGNWVSILGTRRSAFDKRYNPAPQAGNYTMIVPGATTDPTAPAGTGYGMVRVDTRGRVRFAASLADGSRFSQSAMLTPDGQWPLFGTLNRGNGVIMSWMTFTNQAQSDLSGALSWIMQPYYRSRYYQDGFTNNCEAVGSAFIRPDSTNQVLNFTSPYLGFIGGNLPSDIWTPLVVGERRDQASGTNVVVKFSRSRGTFSGKMLNPTTSRWSKFGGVALQKMNAASGYLFGTNQSSKVILVP